MYIEFILASGAAGLAAQHSLYIIKLDLEAWSEKYDIKYTSKIVKYTLRVFLPTPECYSMFALTWDDIRTNAYATARWRLVEPMDPPKSID